MWNGKPSCPHWGTHAVAITGQARTRSRMTSWQSVSYSAQFPAISGTRIFITLFIGIKKIYSFFFGKRAQVCTGTPHSVQRLPWGIARGTWFNSRQGQTVFCTPPPRLSINGYQRSERKVYDLPAPSDKVINAWSYTSTSWDIFMTLYSMKNNCLYD
jgi:hypothetical protein